MGTRSTTVPRWCCYFDAEQAAIGLGIFLEKQGVKYVRRERVRKYLNSPQVEKGDFITEPQFYKLAIKANNETAEKFQDWVTQEVLPSIRKHGAYMTDEKIEEALLNPDTIIELATKLKTERSGRLIAEQRPIQPVLFYFWCNKFFTMIVFKVLFCSFATL